MPLQIVSIKDRALDAYMRPFAAQTTGQAIRMFQDEINNPGTELNKHPDDYDLYHLAEWDEANAKFTVLENAPKLLALGKSLVQK